MVHVVSCGGVGLRATSVLFRWQLGQQLRLVASNDPADFVIDGRGVIERLDLLTDRFKVVRAQRTTVQELYRHAFAPPRGRRPRAARSAPASARRLGTTGTGARAQGFPCSRAGDGRAS